MNARIRAIGLVASMFCIISLTFYIIVTNLLQLTIPDLIKRNEFKMLVDQTLGVQGQFQFNNTGSLIDLATAANVTELMANITTAQSLDELLIEQQELENEIS